MFNLFNWNKKSGNTSLAMQILFYKDANEHGCHGQLYVNHVQFGLKNEPINFFFKDVESIPLLDPEVLAYVWDQAQRQGFVPLSIRGYATVYTIMPAPKMNISTHQPRQNQQPKQQQHRSPRTAQHGRPHAPKEAAA